MGALICIIFWTIKSEEIVSLLTFVVPYAFTGYYPVAILLGKNIGNNILGYFSPAIALLFACFACLMWKKGLKHHGSAGAVGA